MGGYIFYGMTPIESMHSGSGGSQQSLYIAMEITMWMLFDVLFI